MQPAQLVFGTHLASVFARLTWWKEVPGSCTEELRSLSGRRVALRHIDMLVNNAGTGANVETSLLIPYHRSQVISEPYVSVGFVASAWPRAAIQRQLEVSRCARMVVASLR
jgi:hypothetical protein